MSGLEGTSFGSYHFKHVLGRGGMSEVYLAYDDATEQDVAIKVIGGNNADYLERFRREAEAIDKLQHDHILPALDYDDQDPWHFLVILYAPGGTLRDLLEEGPLTPEDADEMLDQIASALQFAHDHGVLHRDIKPSNILLRDKHYAYLADFGLAKLLTDTSDLTRTGILMGTPEYMAPELADGPATKSCDIYALGILLYQMLTGTVPFQGDNPFAIYRKQIRERPIPPSHLNPEITPLIDLVIMRALEKDPRKRIQSAQGLADAYRHALSQSSEDEYIDSQEYYSERSSSPNLRRNKSSDAFFSASDGNVQERHTPQPASLPPLPMRSSPSGHDSSAAIKRRRAQRLKRRQLIIAGVIIIGILLFIVLPMSYIYYIYLTQGR